MAVVIIQEQVVGERSAEDGASQGQSDIPVATESRPFSAVHKRIQSQGAERDILGSFHVLQDCWQRPVKTGICIMLEPQLSVMLLLIAADLTNAGKNKISVSDSDDIC